MPRIVIYHGSYGCDTGCCGHSLQVTDDAGKIVENAWEFIHPNSWRKADADEINRAWAEDWVRSVGCDPSDIDWENCFITDD